MPTAAELTCRIPVTMTRTHGVDLKTRPGSGRAAVPAVGGSFGAVSLLASGESRLAVTSVVELLNKPELLTTKCGDRIVRCPCHSSFSTKQRPARRRRMFLGYYGYQPMG
jgi:hypothetical protein